MSAPTRSPRTGGRAALLPLLAGTMLLAGCGDGAFSDGAVARPELGVGMPERLLATRAIDRTELSPTVTLSTGQSVLMRRVEEALWSGTVRVAPGSELTIEVLWTLQLGGRELKLASLTQNYRVGSDGGAVSVSAADYDYGLDEDADGIANLDELELGSDPFSAAAGDGVAGEPADAPPSGGAADDDAGTGLPDASVPVDVFVPRVASSDVPTLDGLNVVIDANGRFVGEWADAVQIDASGAPLGVNHLMIDLGSGEANDTPNRSWAALHDGEWLYVVVMVEDDGLRFGDSELFWQDDGIEIFIDGDHGRATSYGDDDDFHIILPLLEPGTRRSPNATDVAGFMFGPFSAENPIDLDFVTGPGLGPDGIARPRFERDVYEFRIALDSVNVEPGRPFGFELQVNDDDDGGQRDAKWGWAHPPRARANVDFTFVNPSFMGTLLLD